MVRLLNPEHDIQMHLRSSVCVMPPVATATTATTAFSRAPNCHTQRLHTAASVHPPTYCLRLCDVLMLGCRHASSANMLCERALVCRRVLPIAGLDFCNRESERARPPNNVCMCICLSVCASARLCSRIYMRACALLVACLRSGGGGDCDCRREEWQSSCRELGSMNNCCLNECVCVCLFTLLLCGVCCHRS